MYTQKGSTLVPIWIYASTLRNSSEPIGCQLEQFDALLHLIRPVVSKQDNNYRESIGAEERLVITLR